MNMMITILPISCTALDLMSLCAVNEIILDGMGKHFDKRLEPYYTKALPNLIEYILR